MNQRVRHIQKDQRLLADRSRRMSQSPLSSSRASEPSGRPQIDDGKRYSSIGWPLTSPSGLLVLGESMGWPPLGDTDPAVESRFPKRSAKKPGRLGGKTSSDGTSGTGGAPVSKTAGSGWPAMRRPRYRIGLLLKTSGIELDCCPASTGNEIRRASLLSARGLIIL